MPELRLKMAGKLSSHPQKISDSLKLKRGVLGRVTGESGWNTTIIGIAIITWGIASRRFAPKSLADSLLHYAYTLGDLLPAFMLCNCELAEDISIQTENAHHQIHGFFRKCASANIAATSMKFFARSGCLGKQTGGF